MSVKLPETAVANLPAALPDDVVVLDVRESDEWEAGHINGAMHMPMGQVPARFSEMPADRQVLVVCKVGGRSARVTAYLQMQGVDAVNLADGMVGWHAAGRPMVAESPWEPYVL
ncbi:MAG: rhodanese-like domain-containing protein [Nocardioidaceae bacterium]